MPSKLRSNISGEDIIKFFKSHNFEISRTKGSHIVMKRYNKERKEVLIIPNHKTILKGTLKAIFNQSSTYISVDQLHDFFYTE